MATGPLSDAGRRRPPAAARRAGATPVTRVRPGPRRPAGALKYGFNDVRDVLERASARETTARVAAGARPRVPPSTRHRNLVMGVPVAVETPGRPAPADEADASPLRRPSYLDAETATHFSLELTRRGQPVTRSAGCSRWWSRCRSGSALRALGSPARCCAGGGGHEHQHRERRGDSGSASSRRAASGPRSTTSLRAAMPAVAGRPVQQRGRADRRCDQRRAARGPRRRQAHLDPRPAAAVRRPDHRRGRRQGPLRAQRHLGRAGGGRRRRGLWSCWPRPRRSPTSAATRPLSSAAAYRHAPARPRPRRRRVPAPPRRRHPTHPPMAAGTTRPVRDDDQGPRDGRRR